MEFHMGLLLRVRDGLSVALRTEDWMSVIEADLKKVR
jgi:hypothetical protein